MSIVILASEFSHCRSNGGRDKIFWCCLTPQSPWLQHLRLANGLSGWRQGGVGLRVDKNNGAKCLSQHYLPATCSFFPSNKSGQPMTALCCGGRIYTHIFLIHTHTHTHRKKAVSGGWEQKNNAATTVCADVKRPNFRS